MAFEDKVLDIAEAVETIISTEMSEECTVELFMRARAPKHPPVLWIDMGIINGVENTGRQERWEQAVTFVAVVKDRDPKAGRKEAMRLVSKARRLLMAYNNNRLGLDSFVTGCSGGSVIPDTSGPNEGDLYTANATIFVKFYTCD